jgi:hypothetical protein
VSFGACDRGDRFLTSRKFSKRPLNASLAGARAGRESSRAANVRTNPIRHFTTRVQQRGQLMHADVARVA